MPTGTKPQPLVLVVEDDEYALQSRTEALSDADCAVVGVPSLGDAMRELRTEPKFDLIITDIRLSPSADDKSGIELARHVRDQHPDLPIAGYSAVFADHDLSDDMELFDAISVKGSMDYRSIDETVKHWRRLAEHHRFRDQRHEAAVISGLQADVTDLNSRVSELDRTVQRVKETGLSQDRVVWTVLAVLGAILGLLGTLVAVSLGVAELLRWP